METLRIGDMRLRSGLETWNKQTNVEHRDNCKCTDGILDRLFRFQAAGFIGMRFAAVCEKIVHVLLPTNSVATLFSQNATQVKNFNRTLVNKIFNLLILNGPLDPVPSTKAGFAPPCHGCPSGTDRFAAAYARLDARSPSMRFDAQDRRL